MNKKELLFEEIKNLKREIENINSEIIFQKEEIKKSTDLLEKRKKEREAFIRELYSTSNIDNMVSSTLLLLDEKLNSHYKSKFTPNIPDFEKEIKLEIFTKDFYTIISRFNYKHKSNKLRFGRFLNFIVYGLLAFAVIFIASNYLSERDYSGEKHLTWLGVFAVVLGWILFIASFIQLFLLSSILGHNYKKKIIAIKTEDLSQKIEYLNSLHKLPKEVKKVVTQNFYKNGK